MSKKRRLAQSWKCWLNCLRTSKKLTFTQAERNCKNNLFSSKVKCPISVKRVEYFLVRKVPFSYNLAGCRRKEEWRNIEKWWLNCFRTSKMLTFSQAERSRKKHTFSLKVKCPISVKRVEHFLVRKVPFSYNLARCRRKEEWLNIEKCWLNCLRTSKMRTFSQAERSLKKHTFSL